MGAWRRVHGEAAFPILGLVGRKKDVTLQGLSFVPLSLDEKIMISLLMVTAAGIIHGFAYTTAEGAAATQRIILRRSADTFAAVAVYVILRAWS